jgi:hypothetical protein
LRCGHKCSKACFKCQELSNSPNLERTNHGKCKTKCNKLLNCGHMCNQYCHDGECRPCNNKCAVSCDHITCNENFLEPCAVCAKKCSWKCEHQGKCKLSCGIPCDRLPCNERCNEKTKCGHKCAGVCGEICPPYCDDVNCASEKIKNQGRLILIIYYFVNFFYNFY